MLKRAIYGTLTVILVVGALVAALALYILFTRQGDPTVWPIVRLMLTVVLLVTAVALIWVPRTTREIEGRTIDYSTIAASVPGVLTVEEVLKSFGLLPHVKRVLHLPKEVTVAVAVLPPGLADWWSGLRVYIVMRRTAVRTTFRIHYNSVIDHRFSWVPPSSTQTSARRRMYRLAKRFLARRGNMKSSYRGFQ